MTILELDPPLSVAGRTLVRYLDGHTYESAGGATYYSGAAEPSAEDAADCLATPRTPPAAAPALPAVLPAWRIHAIAKLHGLAATITTILAALPEPQKTIATAAWTQGNEIARDSATYLAIVAALALDSEAEAGLWAAAAALVV